MKTCSLIDPAVLDTWRRPSRWLAGVVLTLTGCAAAPREAPMLARPDSIVVHVSPEALAPKNVPVGMPCTPPRTADASPISQEEIRAAVGRLPPSEQHIEITAVHATPTIEGRLRVQGRGRGMVNGGAPWQLAMSYTAGGATPLPTQVGPGAALEVALPGDVPLNCEEAVKAALRDHKALEVTGTGRFASTSTGGSAFGLFVLERVTSCTAHT